MNTSIGKITKMTCTKTNPLHRPGKQLRAETESVLRDMAYVLNLTRRVKEQMVEEKQEAAWI